MRNLVLYDLRNYDFFGSLAGATDVLLENDSIYIVLDKSVYRYDLDGSNRVCISNGHKCTTRLTSIVLEQTIWFGTGKEYVNYCPVSKVTDVIASETGFLASEWSPSQETLAVVSDNNKVLLLYFNSTLKELECLGTSDVADAVTNATASVGWGSSDTQFRGSKRKPSVTIATVSVNEITDRNPRIVWRDDGEYFLINYWVEGKRMFKVFQLPCSPVYVCDDSPGLQAPISWRCTGNMITGLLYADVLKVAIFEKNGLLRNSYQLYDQIEVVDLLWNSTGEILAIHQKSGDQSYLSLYKMNNYHWYLKQRLDFNKENPLTSFKWSNRTDGIFELIVSTAAEILVYRFIYKVHRCLAPHASGTCVVIDGCNMLVYNFDEVIVSPPYTDKIIGIDHPVTHILFHPMMSEAMVIDCRNDCYVVNFQRDSKDICVNKIPIEFRRYPYNLHHFCWIRDGSLFAIGRNGGTDNLDTILKFDSSMELLTKNTVQSNINYIKFIDESRSFLKLCNGQEVLLAEDFYTTKYSQSAIIALDLYDAKGTKYLFSLNLANQFYIDNICVAEDVTSILIHSNYLYITTHMRLYCLRLLTNEVKNIMSSKSLKNSYFRSMEKGGFLISGVPQKCGVILQMPRGNVELNTCRIVAIDKLEELLKVGLWREGSELIRLERLNTNLLFDLNPARFLSQTREFLLCVNANNLITRFLQELINENVLQTTYKQCMFEAMPFEDKRKSVSKAIISQIHDLDVLAFVKVAVKACVIMDGLDCSLNYLKQIYSVDPQNNGSSVREGLDYLKLHHNSKDICNSALSTYDTSFALFVYQQSSMDPALYNSMFDGFNACERKTEKWFKINDHLGLKKQALMYYSRDLTDQFLNGLSYTAIAINPLIDYAVKNKLLSQLYDDTDSSQLFFEEISLAYAAHLSKCYCYKEAAMVYARAKFYQEALEQFILTSQWQEGMIMLEKAELDETQKLVFVTKIAKGLESSGNYKDASFLCEVYLKDCELSVPILIKGNLFSEAMRVALKFGRSDLIETIIEPSFLEFVDNISKKLDESRTNFIKYKTRLAVVRKQKLALFTNSVDDLDDSNFAANQPSSAISIISGTTTTTKSTRSRRTVTSVAKSLKQELKTQDLREGGFYEDIALMRTLHQLIRDVWSMGPDVSGVCSLLLQFRSMKLVKNLQNSLQELQQDMSESFVEIWPANLNSFHAVASPELLTLRENLEFLAVEYRCPPQQLQIFWKLFFQ